MRQRDKLDEIGENVRRAQAIAHLTQAALDQSSDLSAQTSLAMCVVDDLLGEAVAKLEALEAG